MTPMLRRALFAATILAAGPVFAQDAEPPKQASAPEKDYTIIKMDGAEIKNSEVVDIWKGLFPAGSAPDFSSFDENIRQNVLRGLVSERLIYQEAVKAGLDTDAEVKKRIAAMEKQVIMQTFMERKAKDIVTEKDLRAAYDEKVKSMKGQEEVHARHILVASEDEAKAVADAIKKGESFDKLAREKSTDKGSGARGGDLGWFTQDKMVPEFSTAAFKLKKGEISEPVQSPFGWHIIKAEERRAITPPSFEDAKESLKSELANKKVQDYVEGLLKNASIKYYNASGKEQPFSTSLTPAAGAGQPQQ